MKTTLLTIVLFSMSCNTFSDLGSTNGQPDTGRDLGVDVKDTSPDSIGTKDAQTADAGFDAFPDGTLVVNTTMVGQPGCTLEHCTLQDAVAEANARGGDVSITFLPLDGTIDLEAPLVVTADDVSIEVDLNQPVLDENRPIVIVDGDFDGFVLEGTNLTVNGLSILREIDGGAAIRVEGDGARLIDVQIGLGLVEANGRHDVGVLALKRTTILSSTVSNARVSGIGIGPEGQLSVIEQCYVGTNLDANGAAPNGVGISILADDVIVTDSIVSGNANAGIVVQTDGMMRNSFTRNRIGLDSMNQPLPNGGQGLLVLNGLVTVGGDRDTCGDPCNGFYSASGKAAIWTVSERALIVSGNDFGGSIGIRVGGVTDDGDNCTNDRACESGGCFMGDCVPACETAADCASCTDGLCLSAPDRMTVERDMTGAKRATIGRPTEPTTVDDQCEGLCNRFRTDDIAIEVGRSESTTIYGNAFVKQTGGGVGITLDRNTADVKITGNVFAGPWSVGISSRGLGHVVRGNKSTITPGGFFLETEQTYVSLVGNDVTGTVVTPNTNGFVNWEGNTVTTEDPAAALKSAIPNLFVDHSNGSYQFAITGLVRPVGVLYPYTNDIIEPTSILTCRGGTEDDEDSTNVEAQCPVSLPDAVGFAYYQLILFRIPTAADIGFSIFATSMSDSPDIVEDVSATVVLTNNVVDRKSMIMTITDNHPWIRAIELPNGETGMLAIVSHDATVPTINAVERTVLGNVFSNGEFVAVPAN